MSTLRRKNVREPGPGQWRPGLSKAGCTSWEEQECLVWADIAQKQGSRVEEVRAEQQSRMGGGTV